MATPAELYAAVRNAHEITAEFAGVPTLAQVEGERDDAVTSFNLVRAERDSLTVLVATLQAKLAAAKTEADEVVAEAQDARAKLE